MCIRDSIPSVGAFVIGLVGGVALHCLGIPAMMLGLGVYLPFYMTISAALGACVKWAYDRLSARSAGKTGTGTVDNAKETTHDESGIIVASGVLGGESIVGLSLIHISSRRPSSPRPSHESRRRDRNPASGSA